MPNKPVKKGSLGKKIAVGAGVAAAGAAAYMLLGPDGKKNRAKVSAFAKKVKSKAMNNKEIMAMASAAAAGLKMAKSKAKKAVKKSVSSAKAGAKKVMSSAKKAVKKTVNTAKRATN